MTLDTLNNPAQLSEQRAKINSAIGAVNTGINATAVTADVPFVATDAGGTFSNNTTTNHTKALIAGLGHVVLEQSSTGTLSVSQGSATALTGMTSTTATQRRVWLTEVAPGVYQGSASCPTNLGTAATHASTDFAPAGSGTNGAPTASDVGALTQTQGDARYVQPGLLGSAAGHAATDFATSTQGGKADSAVQSVKTVNGKALAGTGDAGLTAADVHAAPAGSGVGGAVNKADVGLSSVDNTNDASKPVSTLQAAALALKVPAAGVQATNGAFVAADAGSTQINATTAAIAKALIPGLGCILLSQASTGTLTVTSGTATLTGVTATTTAQRRVEIIEESAGVYRGEIVSSTRLPSQASFAAIVSTFDATLNDGNTCRALDSRATYRSNGAAWMLQSEFDGATGIPNSATLSALSSVFSLGGDITSIIRDGSGSVAQYTEGGVTYNVNYTNGQVTSVTRA